MDNLQISNREFTALREIMYEVTGVQLTEAKKTLVVSRLRKRLGELGLGGFEEYIQTLKQKNTEEMTFFINAITTNETFFFRHEQHFEFIETKVLPNILANESSREIKIWSAASSTGEEPYTIAIMVKEFFAKNRDWKLKIYASDINSLVLEQSKIGIYTHRSISRVTKLLKQKYFVEISAENKYQQHKFQLSKDILNLVQFQQHNLLKPFMYKELDIIFLRNVMIYFDRISKQKVIDHMERTLRVGGYFLISLSESLFDVKTSLQSVAPGIYQKI